MPDQDQKPTPRLKFNFFHQFAAPFLCALFSALFYALAEFDLINRLFGLSRDGAGALRLQELALILSRMLLIIAMGWTITVLVDLVLKRRLSSLKLGERNNLDARKRATKLDVLRRIWLIVGGTVTVGMALMAAPWARQVGVSLFASAGIAGIAIGLAARPVLANLIAGLQIAFTQPVRLDDAVVIENEWGWIEEIGLFYVVIRLWDWRRLVIPLSYLIEKPFQNWTRKDASILGATFWWVDYRAPVRAMREKLKEICASTELWDGNITNLQVVETSDRGMQIRALATAATSPEAWDLRCYIREEMIAWLRAEHPEALPRMRAEIANIEEPAWVAKEPATPRAAPATPERDPNLDEK